MKTFELNITISAGGADVDIGLLPKINSFISERAIAGKFVLYVWTVQKSLQRMYFWDYVCDLCI